MYDNYVKYDDNEFLKKLKKTYLENNKSWHATIELTYRCNFNCKHCYCTRNATQELNFAEIENLAVQLKKLGVVSLTLTGGEALIREDIYEILSMLNKYGFIITLFSNGYLIDSNVAKKLKNNGVTCVEISIYGATNSTYSEVTGAIDGYDKLLRAYKSLEEQNILVINKAIMLNINTNEFNEMLKLGKANGLLKTKFDPVIFPKLNHDKTPQDFICTTKQMYKLFYRCLEKSDIIFNQKKFDEKICSIGGSIVINPYGDVLPCTAFSMSVGNIRNDNLTDIWEYSPELNKLRKLKIKHFEKCSECDCYDFCNICPALFYMENNSLTIPAKTLCEVTKIKKKAYNDKFNL